MSYYGAADGDLKWWQLKAKSQAKKAAGTLPAWDASALTGGSADTTASDSTTGTGTDTPAWLIPVGIVGTLGLLGVAAYVATRNGA